MKFVIVADSFDDRSGGLIVLHLLCRRLRDAGEAALIWPSERPRLQFWRNPRRYLGWARYHLTRRERYFSTGPFGNPLARSSDLAGAVIVYPEIISGNPLKGRSVVRWLLHKPGFHTGTVEFGGDDLLFYYQDAFYDPDLGDYMGNRLTISWLNTAYRQTNFGERSGSCYLLKKGRGTALVHPLQDSIPIDALSHEEKSAIFNRTEYFFTYDAYTMYSRYAAICGCVPIIVPQPGVSREQWVASPEERYGLAYGKEDIDWAVSTRPRLLERIAEEQAIEAEMLRSFIAKCRDRFG